jgi:hypothetical protein
MLTTVIELTGIIIAATSGVSMPVKAKESPVKLYAKEKVRHTRKIVLEKALVSNKGFKAVNDPASIMASEEGVKRNASSETAIPTSAAPKAPESFNPSPIIRTFLLAV